MDRKWLLLALPLCVAAGLILGILFQRFYGAGSLQTLLGLDSSRAPISDIRSDPSATPGLPGDLYGRLSLFILAGQSNMSGRGDLPASQPSHGGVFTFGNDYRWKRAREPVDDPADQVDSVSEDGREDPAGFGPALSFALAVASERPQWRIGLIPCAKGNSTIEEWQRSLSDSTLYGSCLKRIKAASLAGDVSGLLFFQGEADALTPEQNQTRVLSVENYTARFSDVVNALRQDLSLPNLPIVFAQIGNHKAPLAFANWERIREQQRAVRLPCGAMITTADLPLRDAVHFTTPAYEIVGQRFAAAYLALTAAAGCSP